MDIQVKYAFLITTLAGLSTMIGALIILFKRKNNNILTGSLAFAAGVMTTVSLIDLIPESIKLLLKYFYHIPAILISLIFISIGIIISISIDKYLPTSDKTNNKLYRVGIISMLAIILHNIPEGIATFIASNNDIKLGISLAIAIALHNIPEGITISAPIYYSTNSRGRALLYTFISGISELIGAIITYLFLSNFINDFFIAFLFSIIAGIMIQISIYELLPASLEHKNRGLTIKFLVLGAILMIINHILL